MTALTETSGRALHLIEDPVYRAVIPGTEGARSVALDFRYGGATDEMVPLAGGEVRHQIAIKMLDLDGDSVLYGVWTWSPWVGFWATLKVNGDYTRARDIYRDESGLAPKLGAWNRLHAHWCGDFVRIAVNGAVVWAGAMHADVHDLAKARGLAGIRTDNAVVAIRGIVAE